MTDKADTRVADRRGFLKLAGAGLVAGGAGVSASAPPAEAAADAKESGRLYRETEHIKTYYELARY